MTGRPESRSAARAAMHRSRIGALAGLTLAFAVSAAEPSATTDADALSKARAVGTKSRAAKTYYSKEFDLSGLPPYVPEGRISGVIRQWGNNYIQDSPLVKVWEREFRTFHPEARFADNLSSSAVAFPGLIAGVADLAPMGRQALWDELKGFEREGAAGGDEGSSTADVVEIVMATGSFDVRGWTFALGVFVHKDNPLSKLTLDQLDGVFGGERSGGWDGLTWRTDLARGPEKNIRTWGQLGLGGEWADKPIHVYAYNLNYHFPRDFAEKVMGGGYKWNEAMREFSNAAAPDGKALISAGDLLIKELASDRYGITYTSLKYMTPQTKTVPLARTAQDPYVLPTLETVQARTYPLAREVYYYAVQRPGQPMNPLVKEYLRFVLSREGQQAVQRDGKYLPMTAAFAAEQRTKLEAGGKAAKSDGG